MMSKIDIYIYNIEISCCATLGFEEGRALFGWPSLLEGMGLETAHTCPKLQAGAKSQHKVLLMLNPPEIGQTGGNGRDSQATN